MNNRPTRVMTDDDIESMVQKKPAPAAPAAVFIAENDAGDREVRLFEPAPLWRRIFGATGRWHVFVQPQPGSTVWHRRHSGRRATVFEERACCDAVERARQSAAARQRRSSPA